MCSKCGSGDRASWLLKPTLVDDLLDVLWRSYDGVDHVVVDGVRETKLDSAKSDHPRAAMGKSRRHRAMWLRISTCIAGWLRSMSLRYCSSRRMASSTIP